MDFHWIDSIKSIFDFGIGPFYQYIQPYWRVTLEITINESEIY